MPQPPMSAQEVWQSALVELQRQMARSTFNAWLRPSHGVALEDHRLVVGVHCAGAKEWIEQRLDTAVHETVRRVAGAPLECQFVVQGNGHRRSTADATQEALPFDRPAQRGPRPGGMRLNPRYTFDTFVVGSGSRMAHAAAQAVAEHPAARYNPLFIYGGAGLGKTHLLHAIGHAAAQRGADVRIVSSEQFMNDLINAIRANTAEAFRAYYRGCGMLLVDDIHFIAGRESTQEEFFHTFNTVHDGDGQIVITSDRSPSAIATLEHRLRSRFEWGLIVDIEPPDLETRIAILRAKIEQQGAPVPPSVVDVIAQAVHNNVRELEGALNRVVMYAKCRNASVTEETARQALAEYMVRREPPSLGKALSIVADYYHLQAKDLEGRSRAARVSEPRQVAMYLMRQVCEASYPAIGAELGGRDHSTVLHGCEKISRLIERDPQLRRDVMQLTEHLYAK
jgi:chromosomal replication initiator protein